MAKGTSLAELHSQRAPHGESKARKRGTATLSRRVQNMSKELSALPVKPLLIGAGIGAALLGAALTVTAKRRPGASFALSPALTKTALVAAARVISGQTVRCVATTALLDVAEALKR